MPTHTIHAIVSSKKSLADYAELRRRVRETIAVGKERSLAAVERERVRTKWEVGKLIQEHILLNQDRADYGKRVIIRLGRDLGKSETELKYMVEFARTYPIRPSTGELSWAHHRELLSVNDPEKRLEITKKARQEHWSEKDLRREIKKRNASKQITVSKVPAEEPLIPIKGKLDTYRVITAKAGPWTGQTALDLGFANYHLPTGGLGAGLFKEGQIVIVGADPRVRPSLGSLNNQGTHRGVPLQLVKDATERDLFTFRAYLLEVTDADTLWVLIDLGFGFITRQHLRLRGIDAPEMNTRAGLEAKRFVERELKKATHIVITTTKSDKYDRYLADVFYTVNGKERFLNNRLLETGHAERV